MSELRNYKRSLKTAQSELSSLQETYDRLRDEKETLHSRNSILKGELTQVEDDRKALDREVVALNAAVKTAKVRKMRLPWIDHGAFRSSV